MLISSASACTSTYVEDLETGNIQDTDEVLSLLFGVQSFVDSSDHPLEETIENGLRQGTDRVADLLFASSLSDELVSYFDSRFAQILVQIGSVQTQEVSDSFTLFGTVGLSLLFSGPLLELQAPEVHHSGRDFVDVFLLFFGETKNVEGFLLLRFKISSD